MYSTYEVVAYTVCLRMQKYWLPVLCFHLEGQMLFFFVLSVMCDGCSYFKLYQSSCLTNSVEKKNNLHSVNFTEMNSPVKPSVGAADWTDL